MSESVHGQGAHRNAVAVGNACRRAASRVRADICTLNRCRHSTGWLWRRTHDGVALRVPAVIGWTHRGKVYQLISDDNRAEWVEAFQTKKGAARSTDELAGSDTMGPVIETALDFV